MWTLVVLLVALVVIFLLAEGYSSIVVLFTAVDVVVAPFFRSVHVVQVELLGPCFVEIVFARGWLKFDRGSEFRIIILMIIS